MRNLWIVVAVGSLVVLAFAVFTLWQQRNDHLQTALLAERLNACGAIAGASADFLGDSQTVFDEWRANNAVEAATVNELHRGPGEVIAAASVGLYVLPREGFETALEKMIDAAKDTNVQLARGDLEQIEEHMDEFDAVHDIVQDECAEMFEGSRFAQ